MVMLISTKSIFYFVTSTLLVGVNGAGKSTLLQLLAGKRMIKDAELNGIVFTGNNLLKL